MTEGRKEGEGERTCASESNVGGAPAVDTFSDSRVSIDAAGCSTWQRCRSIRRPRCSNGIFKDGAG